MIATGEPAVLEDCQAAQPGSQLAPLDTRAIIGVPVHEQSQVIGSLVVASTTAGRRWTEHERALLTAYAEHVGVVVAVARASGRRRAAGARRDPRSRPVRPGCAATSPRCCWSGAADPAAVATRIIDAVNRRFEIDETEVSVTVRVGIAIGRDEAETLTLRIELRRAIEREELELHYQPIFDLRTGRIATFEGLVRRRHPDRGLVPPLDFIPIAEQSGMIIEIGH